MQSVSYALLGYAAFAAFLRAAQPAAHNRTPKDREPWRFPNQLISGEGSIGL
jgi:hypothetical protein